MSKEKKENPAAELGYMEKELLTELSRDAQALVTEYTRNVELRDDPSGRRSAFAAFEVSRNICTAPARDFLYASFVLLSVGAALYIGFAVPRELKSLAWDAWGLASTLLLLVLTYGIYVLLTFYHEVRRAMRPGQVADRDQNRTFGHVIFCGAGIWLTVYAKNSLIDILHETTLRSTDAVALNKSYASFVIWVSCLAVLFVIMDYWVAVFDDSHNETFIAASSFVHSTLPMAIGILVIGLYMTCDYISLLYQGKNSSDAFAQLPVEFVSGALSFQMIMSNTLFAFIKRNLFLRFAYFATGSTKSF